MHERLIKIRKENPNFDKEMVDVFAKKMPELLNIMIEGKEYDNHIGTKSIAMLAEPYIKNADGKAIGFKWTYDDVVNTVKNYIDLEEQEFYGCDIWVWANVKYGDMSHITTDASTILKYAIAELTDDDFPFYPASQRAYYWLKKHIEKDLERGE
jgi:hypothetical protein